MGAKVLNSDNETLKQEVLFGEISINVGCKEFIIQECRNMSNDVEGFKS